MKALAAREVEVSVPTTSEPDVRNNPQTSSRRPPVTKAELLRIGHKIEFKITQTSRRREIAREHSERSRQNVLAQARAVVEAETKLIRDQAVAEARDLIDTARKDARDIVARAEAERGPSYASPLCKEANGLAEDFGDLRFNKSAWGPPLPSVEIPSCCRHAQSGSLDNAPLDPVEFSNWHLVHSQSVAGCPEIGGWSLVGGI